MEVEEEDDDTHLCLRCNAKIIGLGNYVEHRKSFCSTTKLINKTRTTTTSGGGEEQERIQGTLTDDGSKIPLVEIGQVGDEVLPKTTISQEDEDEHSLRNKTVKNASSVVVDINNKDQLKFKAPLAVETITRPETRDSNNFSLKLSDTSFPEDDHHHQSNYSTTSKTSLDKSLDFNLDYDIIDHVPTSPSRVVAGTRTEGDYDYEGANLFFSSLQLQSSSKRATSKRDTGIVVDRPENESRSGKRRSGEIPVVRQPLYEELEEGSSDGEENYLDNGSDFDFALEDLDESSNDLEFDEDSFRVPPRTHTGGKWKPDDRPGGTTSTVVSNVRHSSSPSSARTRSPSPRYRLSNETVHYDWESTAGTSSSTNRHHLVEDEEQRDFSPNYLMSPPQNYTRGKWIPGREMEVHQQPRRVATSINHRSSESLIKEQIVASDNRTITPGRDAGTEKEASLWCSVCNLTLSSKLIFQRHLTSNKHKKREMQERELEQGYLSYGRDNCEGGGGDKEIVPKRSLRCGAVIQNTTIKLESSGGQSRESLIAVVKTKDGITRNRASIRDEAGLGKRKNSKSLAYSVADMDVDNEGHAYVDGDWQTSSGVAPKRVKGVVYPQSSPSTRTALIKPISKTNALIKTKKKRNRAFTFTTCLVCKVKQPIVLMGRHLLSHMHYRRMQLRRAEDQRLVLDYFDQIVRLSPFQCQICRFFANTVEQFMWHWHSEEHKRKVKGVQRMWCSFCHFDEPAKEMTRHLMSEGHMEVVQAVNRTYPIIIREKAVLECCKCHRGFNYNIEIRKHVCEGSKEDATEDLDDKEDTASDNYQCHFQCPKCEEVLRSFAFLKKHNMDIHGQQIFHCKICILTFDTKAEAIKHRMTLQHKLTASKAKGRTRESKACKKCGEEFEDLLVLRKHQEEVHPEEKFSCLLCGAKFRAPQLLSRHIREKACENKEPVEQKDDGHSLHCVLCNFATDSEAELQFHKAVRHDQSELAFDAKAKLKCPLCPKKFKRFSLLGHLRKHTNERIFKCEKCNNGYTRKDNLVQHMVKCRGGEQNVTIATSKTPKPVTYGHLACPEPGCTYQASAKHKLDKHSFIHKEKTFACDQCSYKAAVASVLRKHQLTHSKEQPYQCPVCLQKFTAISNLRKHFMAAHPGKMLYNCGKCGFKTNLQNDLKKHRC